MTSEEEVRRECDKRGWDLIRPRPAVSWWIVTEQSTGWFVNASSTPQSAYLAACERQQVTPF